MPRSVKQLSDTAIRSAKPKEKPYTLPDGRGLHLLIDSNGKKTWEFVYLSPMHHKRRKSTFGTYPTLTLVAAREKREKWHTLIIQGIDPVDDEKKKKLLSKRAQFNTYESLLMEWLKEEEKRLTPSAFKKKKSMLLRFTVKALGNKPMQEIEHYDIVNLLEPLYKSVPTQALKLMSYFYSIWQHSTNKGHCKTNICRMIDRRSLFKKKHIVFNLPKVTDETELKIIAQAIYAFNGTPSTRNAIKLMLFVPLRPNELVGLKWDYIDFENALLTIPRAMMKIKNPNKPDFKLPLSPEALNILRDQFTYSSHSPHVFISFNGRPIHKHILHKTFREKLHFNGKDNPHQSPHGLRGTFDSLCETHDMEHGMSSKIIDACLDHDKTSIVKKAYSGGKDYTAQKRILMNWWGGFIFGLLKD